jgi:glycosyltransferase involved in cell wall biosynthesis
MRVAIVSTYRPRHCGIAVFSFDLRAALLDADSSLSVEIVSIVRGRKRQHPPEVLTTIRQDISHDYAAAALELARQDIDVVLIEHEYGIFGGDAGNFVLNLANELTVPFVVTLHTVLADPDPLQAAALRALCERATLVMVFTETARRMVVEQGLADAELVRVVPHGAPDELTAAAWSDGRGRPTTRKLDLSRLSLPIGLTCLDGRTVLSTFGLISSAKGLELAIQALPPIVAVHPEVVYLIAGETHPDVIQKDGESYRLGLERLVAELGLQDHVIFVDHFLSIEELATLLARTDLYITPYRSRDQIVSGALTFAVAAGCPVVSTPYFYAEDLLSSGAGVLVPFGDSAKLAAAVLELLGSPDKLAAARAGARRVGAELSWASVGKATLEVLTEAAQLAPKRLVRRRDTNLVRVRPSSAGRRSR